MTSFFRDAECFDVLRAQAISQIVAEKKPGEEIRIWVPGCSTGQEAYSIAMLVSEEIARVDANVSVSVFATDIDEETFEFARQAVYPTSIASEVPKPFLERYFDSLPDGYRIKKNLREIVRVSRHNIISDPPFSRLDLISCRNLLIYLENSLQDRITQIFHYSLRPNGFLFLGPSETPAHAHAESFRPIARLERLYQRDSNPAECSIRRSCRRSSTASMRHQTCKPNRIAEPFRSIRKPFSLGTPHLTSSSMTTGS